MSKLIRLILSLLLLYGIYTETGIWTTLGFGLIMITVEIINSTVASINRAITMITELLKEQKNG